MELAYIFVIGLSLAVLGVLFGHSFKRRSVAGARAFMAQIILVAVWALCALFELFSDNVQAILFWRNIQQVGVFGVPVTCIFFAAGYGRYAKWKKFLPLFCIVPAAALALIFTDQSHHIMRADLTIGGNQFFGEALMVTNTPVGMLFVAYNFCLVAISLIMLGFFAAKVAKRMRLQVVLIMASFFLVFGFAFFKTAYLEKIGVNIPIVAFYLPSSLILFYNLFWHKMFMVPPIAREKVFDVIEQGIIVTDIVGTIVDRNPYAIHLMKMFFGIEAELTGKSMASVFPAYPKWVELMGGDTTGQLEVQTPLKDTHTLFVRIKVYPLLSDGGKLIGRVSILRDITERRLQEFELKSKADRDSLTGLLNRSGFLGECRKALEDAKAKAEPVSVLMIDLDRLKPINDTYGHFSGDRVLLSIADMLRGALRQNDAIGRIGGDEFAAVLPGTGRYEALGIAERIRREANGLEIEMENGDTVRASLSIGICDNTGADAEAGKLLDLADKAMYRAKRQSRNCCVVWE